MDDPIAALSVLRLVFAHFAARYFASAPSRSASIRTAAASAAVSESGASAAKRPRPPAPDRAAVRGTAAMLFWALFASGQINMRNVDGWQTLAAVPVAQPIDLAA
jgi:hypothetical protein